ncbi:MAG TPA: hypothetical protein VKJ47_19080, partial [Candidatus Binatia bacterium]|nr:hypothetical protein [Candidatus Binatia bacterium]
MYSANQIVRAWILVLTVLATGSSLSQRPAAPSEQTVQSRAPETAASAAATPDRTRRVAEQAAYGELPLYFEANQGPTDKRVQFLARGTGFTLFLTATEATLALKQKSVARSQKSGLVTQPPIPNSQPAAVLRMYLVSANPHPRITGEDELPGKSHYFFSGNPTRWHTNIPTYAKVRYQDVYPGV